VKPKLSIILPVYQGHNVLPQSLRALAASDLPRRDWELIVVDDASTDDTVLIAAPYADTIVRLSGKPRGPAYARNRGFEASRGEIVVFVDADVCVHGDTLRRFVEVFAANSDAASVFGSYDASPTGQGVVSQFRNLMHHYVHNSNPGDAETFWAGCGAVRASVFAEIGMFNEWHYSRPQIEDIELGRRLRARGHRILLRPEIQCTHLKRWTLSGMVTTDLQHRGVPWMWLLLQEGPSAGSKALNLKTSEKMSAALVGGAGMALLAAALLRSWWPVFLAMAAVAIVLAKNHHFYRYLYRQRGAYFATVAMALHLLFYLVSVFSAVSGWLMHALFGEPAPTEEAAAQAQLGIKTWPPGPVRLPGSLWDARPELINKRSKSRSMTE
jgi:glycosyltransferase involved in cell wall biosynthesis